MSGTKEDYDEQCDLIDSVGKLKKENIALTAERDHQKNRAEHYKHRYYEILDSYKKDIREFKERVEAERDPLKKALGNYLVDSKTCYLRAIDESFTCDGIWCGTHECLKLHIKQAGEVE